MMVGLARTAISDVVGGEVVRLAGRVTADARLEAPLSHRPCIAWQVLLERVSGRNENQNFCSLACEESRASLELRDESGSVVLLPAGGTWSLANDMVTWLEYELDLTPERSAFLARHGIRWKGSTKPVLRFREQVIEQGARVTVLGRAHADGVQLAAGSPYRDAPLRWVVAAGKDEPLVISAGDSAT
jgi:hypothetical protein